jgi:hypothetical protein
MYLVSTYHMPDAVLGAGTIVIKIGQRIQLCLGGVYRLLEGADGSYLKS